jgi:hypothetical protein
MPLGRRQLGLKLAMFLFEVVAATPESRDPLSKFAVALNNSVDV